MDVEAVGLEEQAGHEGIKVDRSDVLHDLDVRIHDPEPDQGAKTH